ncbi:hypothetical protein U91I_02731 [alpha proteobacterium U9-1i]|nr:hypothetical protein U91I_02731 [alpha proteobacterium U9-1i]
MTIACFLLLNGARAAGALIASLRSALSAEVEDRAAARSQLLAVGCLVEIVFAGAIVAFLCSRV